MAHALLLLQPSAVAALCCCSRREVLSVALCCYSRSVEGVLALLVVAHVAVVGLPRSDHAHARELAVLQGQRNVFGVALCCCSRREVLADAEPVSPCTASLHATEKPRFQWPGLLARRQNGRQMAFGSLEPVARRRPLPGPADVFPAASLLRLVENTP